MKKIYITRRIPEKGITMLKEKGYEVDVNMNEKLPTQEEIISALRQKEYDAVITLLTDKIDTTVFDALPQIKMYANYAIGFDNIDVQEAHTRGIFATNTPGAYENTIAEHSIALMLSLTTRMCEADRFMRKGLYTGWSPMNFIGSDLSGKTLGLIGAGKIGEKVAQMAHHGFNLKVLYTDVHRNEKIEKECNAQFVETPEEILKNADIVSLHVPLLPSTHHLINEERLRMMKKNAFLINTSRGPVVDEVALVKALREGVIKGAGLDVFEFEPKLTEGLTELENVVLTPHIASARESARDMMSEIVALNVIDFLEGKTPRNAIEIK